ncbi:MAG TPA: hypothetical protein VLA09_12305 [Longimicrobiales bacterium]|nr:hypothetical protein [Longimicrobiales bacterium]
MILTGGTACDNVGWGGLDWRLMPPPTASADSVPAEAVADEEVTYAGAYGPLLLAGERDGIRATLVVVGEIRGEQLLPLRDTPEESDRVRRLTGEGSRWVLFSDGVRVGRLRADGAGSDAGYCPARPTVTGVVEVVPTASSADRLLALPESSGDGRAYEAFRPLAHVYDQRVATLSWAGEEIPRNQASWPADGLVAAREDIRAFRPAGSPGPAVAATFMYRDRLAVSPAPAGAYALFVLGALSGDEYLQGFSWYRPTDTEGKGAPRFFDHLDWDGDGSGEILLDVFGTERRWFAALSQRDGRWVRTFSDACGEGPIAGG